MIIFIYVFVLQLCVSFFFFFLVIKVCSCKILVFFNFFVRFPMKRAASVFLNHTVVNRKSKGLLNVTSDVNSDYKLKDPTHTFLYTDPINVKGFATTAPVGRFSFICLPLKNIFVCIF
jgi:hypothetical protein